MVLLEKLDAHVTKLSDSKYWLVFSSSRIYLLGFVLREPNEIVLLYKEKIKY